MLRRQKNHFKIVEITLELYFLIKKGCFVVCIYVYIYIYIYIYICFKNPLQKSLHAHQSSHAKDFHFEDKFIITSVLLKRRKKEEGGQKELKTKQLSQQIISLYRNIEIKKKYQSTQVNIGAYDVIDL